MSLIHTLSLDEMRFGDYDNVPVNSKRLGAKSSACRSRVAHNAILNDIVGQPFFCRNLECRALHPMVSYTILREAE